MDADLVRLVREGKISRSLAEQRSAVPEELKRLLGSSPAVMPSAKSRRQAGRFLAAAGRPLDRLRRPRARTAPPPSRLPRRRTARRPCRPPRRRPRRLVPASPTPRLRAKRMRSTAPEVAAGDRRAPRRPRLLLRRRADARGGLQSMRPGSRADAEPPVAEPPAPSPSARPHRLRPRSTSTPPRRSAPPPLPPAIAPQPAIEPQPAGIEQTSVPPPPPAPGALTDGGSNHIRVPRDGRRRAGLGRRARRRLEGTGHRAAALSRPDRPRRQREEVPDRDRGLLQALQEGRHPRARGLLAPVRDPRRLRDADAADPLHARGTDPGREDPRGGGRPPRRRRGGEHPRAGDGPPPRRLRQALPGDGPLRRAGGTARGRPRPDRLPGREGRRAEAPGQIGDDVPVVRLRGRDRRAADRRRLHHPRLREHLRRTLRRKSRRSQLGAAAADPDLRDDVGRDHRLLVHPLPGDRSRS